MYDEKEIEHYRKVIACCKENNMEPVVTLHHFSSPVWLIRKGGWEAESVVEDFGRYVSYVIDKLGSELKYVCTINEANMGLQVAAIAERYAKQMYEAASGEDSVQMGLNHEAMMKNNGKKTKGKFMCAGKSAS